MLTLKATSLWLLYSLGAIALAHPDSDNTGFKRLTISDNNPGTKLLSRQASDTCSGFSCETCFGAGFEPCDSSSTICYLPGDALHGEEGCSATDSDTSTASTSGASSSDTADGVVGESDDTDTSSSGTSTGSSSGTSGSNSNGNGNSNQGSSSTENDANGNPIKKSSGNSVIREGLVGVLSAGGMALVAAWHLLI